MARPSLQDLQPASQHNMSKVSDFLRVQLYRFHRGYNVDGRTVDNLCSANLITRNRNGTYSYTALGRAILAYGLSKTDNTVS